MAGTRTTYDDPRTASLFSGVRNRLTEVAADRGGWHTAPPPKAGALPSNLDPAGVTQLLIAMLAGLELMKVMQPEVPMKPLVEPLRAMLQARLDPDLGSRTG